MNKSRLIWGIICLLLAALLGVLNVVLSSDKLMFMIGDTNMPYVPPIILGVLGIFLLATSGQSSGKPVEDTAGVTKVTFTPDEEKVALNKRLETMAWGFFLIMLGGYMFVPHTVVAKGFWSVAVGLIMLGLNAARYVNGIRMSGFTSFLGIISILGGILQFAGWQSAEGAILLIILGVYLLLKPWFDKHQLFGKAEES